jgi:hypothetical protein
VTEIVARRQGGERETMREIMRDNECNSETTTTRTKHQI